MSKTPRKYIPFVATFALSCFGVGYVGAYGASAVEEHMVMAQAQSAAREVEERKAQLEESITRAHAVAAQAELVADTHEVATAAQSLHEATETAVDTAREHQVEVAAAPIETVDDIPQVLELESDDSEPAAAPSSSPEPSAQPSAAPSSTPSPEAGQTVVATNADLADVVTLLQDPELEKLMQGEIQDVASARESIAQLNQISEALDAAAQELDSEADAVFETADAAAARQAVEDLHENASGTDELTGAAMETVTAVGNRVQDGRALYSVTSAIAAVQQASDAALALDTDDREAVLEHHENLTHAKADLDNAVGAVEDSHAAWVKAENKRRDAKNEARMEKYEAKYDKAYAEHQAKVDKAVDSRSNGWSGKPAGVSGSNGRLSSDSLDKLSFASGHYLQEDAAASLAQANKAFKAETGRNLGITDTYRSYSSQVTTKARKPSTAAVPGTSNHGWGMAVDFDYQSAMWMQKNGEEYGWVHPSWAKPGGSRPEWWHLEYVASDVGAFEAPAKPDLVDPVTNVLTEDKKKDDKN